MREDMIEIAAKLRVACNGVLVGAATGSEEIQVEAINRLMDAAREAAAALEAAREDAEFFRWLAVYPNLYTVCDLLRADQYVTLRRACESLAAIDQARGKGVAE